MQLTKVSVDALVPHPQNYNTHPESQIQELIKSLDEFSQFKNIVVCNGVILAGHGLVEAAKRKGMTEIYALVRNDLTEQQQKALLIADNSMPFMAVPDTGKLEELLADLGEIAIPGVNEEWLHSMRVSQGTSGIDIDNFFGENVAPERKKKTETATCPECGHEFEL